MKANRCIDKIEQLGLNNFIRWSVWIIYTTLIIFLYSVHEPWFDEYHVWSMVYRMSLSELWSAMRIEGHFMLWHLCVLPWVKLFGMDYHAIFVASTILMSSGVWLMIFKLDFSFIGKLFIILSAPFFYYFPVIARCYALIPPILIALAIVYQHKKNPFLYCFLIGLLAHTHAYMEGMVGVLWCVFTYKYVYLPHKNGEIMRVKKNGLASLITVVLVILAFLQIAGGIKDAVDGVSVATHNVNTPIGWITFFYEKFHIQFTSTLHSKICRFIPLLDFIFTLLCYCSIIILSFLFLHKSSSSIEFSWIIIVSVLWQIFFAFNIYDMHFHRVYLLIFPLLYVFWVGSNRNNKCYSTWIIVCLWLLDTTSQYVVLKDIHEIYSYDIYASRQINSNLTEDYPILSSNKRCCELLSRDVLFLDNDKSLNSILSHAYPQDSIFYFVSSNQIDSIQKNGVSVEMIYNCIEGNNVFTDIYSINFVGLYKLTRHEKIY